MQKGQYQQQQTNKVRGTGLFGKVFKSKSSSSKVKVQRDSLIIDEPLRSDPSLNNFELPDLPKKEFGTAPPTPPLVDAESVKHIRVALGLEPKAPVLAPPAPPSQPPQPSDSPILRLPIPPAPMSSLDVETPDLEKHSISLSPNSAVVEEPRAIHAGEPFVLPPLGEVASKHQEEEHFAPHLNWAADAPEVIKTSQSKPAKSLFEPFESLSDLSGLKGRFTRKNGVMKMHLEGSRAREIHAPLAPLPPRALEPVSLASFSIPMDIVPREVKVAPLSDEELTQITRALDSDSEALADLKALEEEHRAIKKELGKIISKPLKAYDHQSEIDELKLKLAAVSVPTQPRCTDDKVFHLSSGQSLRNITDLLKSLLAIPDIVFRHHVTKSKNDFAVWVSDTLGMKDLAAKLDPMRTKSQMLDVLKEWNAQYIRDVNVARAEARRIQQEIAELEGKAKKDKDRYEYTQFFRLHKPQNMRSLLQLLATLEHLYQVDTNTIIIHNKDDFNKWIRQFLEAQKKAETARAAPIKESLLATLDDHAALIKADLDGKLSDIAKQQEELNTAKVALESQHALLEEAKTTMDAKAADFAANVAKIRDEHDNHIGNLSLRIDQDRQAFEHEQQATMARLRMEADVDLDVRRQELENQVAIQFKDLESQRQAIEEQDQVRVAALDRLKADRQQPAALARKSFQDQTEQLEREYAKKREALSEELQDDRIRMAQDLERAKNEHLASLEHDRADIEARQIALAEHESLFHTRSTEQQAKHAQALLELETAQRALLDAQHAFELEQAEILKQHKNTVESLQIQANKLTREVEAQRATLAADFEENRQRIERETKEGFAALDAERREFDAVRAKDEAQLRELEAKIKDQQEKLVLVQSTIRAEDANIRGDLERQKMEIRKDLEEMRRLDEALSRMESRILMEKEALEKVGFRKYLDARLRDVKPSDSGVRDKQYEQEVGMEEAMLAEFYRDVEDAQNLLINKDVDGAKKRYLDIKSRYNAAQLPHQYKSRLYNSIRSLYDDIHLALAAK